MLYSTAQSAAEESATSDFPHSLQGLRTRIAVGIEYAMWLAVSGKKPLQAQYVCMTCVSNDDRATRAAFQQTHAAQDQRPHNPLAKLGFLHQ
jgi:hypothetical protein